MRSILCSIAFFALQSLPLHAAPIGPLPQAFFHLFCDKDVTLNAGTLVMLETAERVSSEQLTVGKVLQFKVTMNVMAEGKVAIRSGALALGRVKAIEKSTYNEPESIRIEMMHVQAVDGQMVPLNGNEQTIQGRYKGEAATIETGTSITANVTNDIEINTK